jgi:hypothetical protein
MNLAAKVDERLRALRDQYLGELETEARCRLKPDYAIEANRFELASSRLKLVMSVHLISIMLGECEPCPGGQP